MHVRPYQQSDLPSIVDVHMNCIRTDPLTHFLNKDIVKYPTSFRLSNYLFLRSGVIGLKRPPDTPQVIHVLETEATDYVPGERYRAPEIVGFIAFTRYGKSDRANAWRETHTRQSWSDKLNKLLIQLEDKYYDLFPSTVPTNNHVNHAQFRSVIGHEWDPEIFGERWELNLLFVRPEWQRKGLAKKLMTWGFEQAQEEKVPLLVKSSAIGGLAYRAVGFKPLFEFGLGRFYNELEFGGEPSQAWVWEPTIEEGDDIEGRWFERAKAKLAAGKLEQTTL